MPPVNLEYLLHRAQQWLLPLTLLLSPGFLQSHRGRKRQQFDRIQGIEIYARSISRSRLDVHRTVKV
jgi:hypothetical protein